MPIDIKSLEIQNFKSFGNYLTKIELDNLGPVLIVGECEESQKVKASKSNGAGKSSLISAIVWVLWGRTHDRARPGDSVINWSIKENCYVRLDTTDGYTIIRTRKFKGKDELVFYKDGKDQTHSTNAAAQIAINKTFGLDYDIFSSAVFLEQRAKPLLEMPPKQRQTVIERMLQLHKLHYRAEVAKELLKKEELEQRELLNEADLYNRDTERLKIELKDAETNQSMFEQNRHDRIIEIEKRLKELNNNLNKIVIPNIEELESRWKLIEQIETKAKELTKQKQEADIDIRNIKNAIISHRENLSDVQISLKNYKEIDLENLRNGWRLYNENIQIVADINSRLRDAQLNFKNLEFQIKEKSKDVKQWKEQAGSTCPVCKQDVSVNHTEHVAKPILDELALLIKQRQSSEANIAAYMQQIKQAQAVVDDSKPEMSLEIAESKEKEILEVKNKAQILISKIDKSEEELSAAQKKALNISQSIFKIDAALNGKRPSTTLVEAKTILKHANSIADSIANAQKEKERTTSEQNPYAKSINRLRDNISVNESKLNIIKEQTNEKDLYIKHYDYIRKAYSDKGKIKGLILNGMIPIINKRLRYYLDKLGFEIADLEFNNLLELESSRWDYTSCSGGERQCLDLALMFALFDMNAIQYGRHSNLMILDEVDGRLDTSYVEKLASVIVDDLSKQSAVQPTTILVVSHKNDMFDAFPTKIVIRKKGGFSYADVEK